MSDQSRNIGHAARVGNIARWVAILLGIATAGATVIGLSMGGWAWLMLAGCAAGWAVLGLFLLVHGTVVEKVGSLVEGVLVPGGSSTPSVAQHSNIEALEMRGQYAEAAQAYRGVIAASPEDLVACEKLGQLALRQLKDYDTALWAYHQAEARAPDQRRRAGYALLALGIVRDNMKDTGRTVVEIRKLLERYPGMQNADALRREMDELKATLFEAQPPR